MVKAKILPTLQKRAHRLASVEQQLQVLNELPLPQTFADTVAQAGYQPLRSAGVQILQMNVGKRCNQTCKHCHVDAGPDRKEVMPRSVLEACLTLLEQTSIPTLDITGGAPELHPDFREIVERARGLDRHVIDRCNLTITLLPNYAYLPEFLAEHRVEVVASLPSFAALQTDAQRGDGVFEQSIQALQHFNELGYGQEGSGLVLNLMTNPVGAFLPGKQSSLENDWRRQLRRKYGIEFTHLYTLNNMPISRYLEFLQETGNLETYMQKLLDAFNPGAVDGLMCRNTLSVGWDGQLYDCDFNQMLEMPLQKGMPQTIFEACARFEDLQQRVIQTQQHCYGCTAGSGSSCGGATT